MTRDTVWQDDPPFAVGETQAVPVADDLIERLERQLVGVPDSAIECISVLHLRSFIARIKAEREQAIRDCIEKVKCMGGRLDDMLERKRVISALEYLSNHSAAGIPSSDPVRELRDNYKCGEEYEAGLWSRRNIEAFFRDQDKKS